MGSISILIFNVFSTQPSSSLPTGQYCSTEHLPGVFSLYRLTNTSWALGQGATENNTSLVAPGVLAHSPATLQPAMHTYIHA